LEFIAWLLDFHNSSIFIRWSESNDNLRGWPEGISWLNGNGVDWTNGVDGEGFDDENETQLEW